MNPLKLSRQTDVLILGGGIIGLSSGIAALQMNPALKILIVDKAESVAEHASGRNSGVLHAGFYYSPESLKAQFCREGSKELKAFAKIFVWGAVLSKFDQSLLSLIKCWLITFIFFMNISLLKIVKNIPSKKS